MSCKKGNGFKPTELNKPRLPFEPVTGGLPGTSDRLKRTKFGKPPVPRAYRP